MVLNWFVNLSKSWRKLNQFTSFGVGLKDWPFFNKDYLCRLSSIFVKLIAFLFGKFFLIYASSFFLRVFLSFLFRLIFYFRFSCEHRRFFFPVSCLFGTLSLENFLFYFFNFFLKMLTFFLIVVIISLYLSLHKSTILLRKMFLCVFEYMRVKCFDNSFLYFQWCRL